METIIRKNSHMQGKEILELERKRLILYNAKKEIFVYSWKKGFSFLNADVSQNENLEEIITNKTGIILQDENLEELMTIINYERFLITYNRKLKEAYKKIISKYYSYYIEFDDEIISKLIACSDDLDYEHLDLVSLDELIQYGDSEYDKHSPVLKKLKNKLEYKEY